MVRAVLAELKTQDIVTFKEPEERAFNRAVEYIEKEFQKERDIEMEANKMVDDLERKNPGGFERHKMFLLVKKQLAKNKGVIL